MTDLAGNARAARGCGYEHDPFMRQVNAGAAHFD